MSNDSFRASATVKLLPQENFKRVAVFRALQLGDMLCAVPALRALRAALPHAHIALIGLPWAKQFVDRYACYVDAFHAFPGHPAFPEQPVQEEVLEAFYGSMAEEKFSLAIQLHGSGVISNSVVEKFGAKVTAGYAENLVAFGVNGNAVRFPYPHHGPESTRLLDLVTLLGAPDCGSHLEFPLHQKDWDELHASGLAVGLEPGSYLCIHPGARFRDKCWPAERFAQVADALADEFGLQIVLTGSSKETELTQAVARCMKHRAIDTASPLSIGAMAALMSGARLLVSNDTGASHIAAGLKLRSVVVFHQPDMERWAPLDHATHRCIHDPSGARVQQVVRQARALLAPSADIADAVSLDLV